MNLQTKITIVAPDFSIDYNSKLMMLGSCFAETEMSLFLYKIHFCEALFLYK